MGESPIIKTLDEMLAKLKEAIQIRLEAEKQISEYTNAIKALAKVVEDEEAGNAYLVALDELSGKPGFLSMVRTILRFQSGVPITPGQVRTHIQLSKMMDLSGYSNPLASIHTTLRRMKDSGEVEEIVNDRGEKSYRMATLTEKVKGATNYGAEGSLANTTSSTSAPVPPKRRIRTL